MSIARTVLLWMSENKKLREIVPQFGFVRRAVHRFIPGEQLEDALAAAEQLRTRGISTIVTRLGENVTQMSEAEEVSNYYLDALEQIHRRNLDCFISVKLTQMGFDIDKEQCYRFFARLAKRAKELSNLVWIDMEGTTYTEDTIVFYERARKEFDNVGLCLQSYLYRTENDVKRLLPSSPLIRLVKGAYKEPPNLAMPKKADVDANYFRLARTLLQNTHRTGRVHGLGTHDKNLVGKIIEEAKHMNLLNGQFEFQMLYGIQTSEQERLKSEGYRVRVLISYGTYWFPWYLRRLAERPANVWFVLKNIFPR